MLCDLHLSKAITKITPKTSVQGQAFALVVKTQVGMAASCIRVLGLIPSSWFQLLPTTAPGDG